MDFRRTQRLIGVNKMVTLFNCFSYNEEWYLVEMALAIPPNEIAFEEITVPEEGVDREHWQAALTEQFLNHDGTERICEIWERPNNGETESRVAFFIFKTESQILETPYGQFKLSDTVKVPDRLKNIIEIDEDYILEYKGTLSSAINYDFHDKLDKWVHAYLQSDGRNQAFSDGLKLFDRYYLGPIKMPLNLFRRCCGPEEGMKYTVNRELFEIKVETLMKAIQEDPDMPPLIVHYVNGEFELNDGNHRYEAYARLGIREAYVIVWITEREEYEDFLAKYLMYMQ